LRFSTEEKENSSDLSFDSSEVSFDSSEVSFDSSEEISLASVESFYFLGSYWKIPPWRALSLDRNDDKPYTTTALSCSCTATIGALSRLYNRSMLMNKQITNYE
jgi:hypothetical protein